MTASFEDLWNGTNWRLTYRGSDTEELQSVASVSETIGVTP
jgi:hypothetical protein